MKGLESLKTIFKDRIFKIPDYQRGYAWTTKELKYFWDDLVNLSPDRFHYTGVLSLKEVKKDIWTSTNWNDERWLIEDLAFKPFHIVDGQQRLTTFVIFIQAISEHLKNLPENKYKKDEKIYLASLNLKEIKKEYLVIEKPNFMIKTYKFGYEVDNPSFEFLRHKIFLEPDSGAIQETFYTLNLENAKLFFKEKLQNHFGKFGLPGIEKLFKKVTQNLMFNVYEISDDFDAFVAFETMNNRGKTLSKLELLKNRLLYLTTLYDEKELKNDERISLRKKINDAWKEVYSQLGRNKKNPLNDDEFLLAHWIMYFQYKKENEDDRTKFLLEEKFTPQNIETEQEEVDVNGEEESIVSRSELSPKEIKDYVNSLKSAAVHWYNIYHPDKNNPDLTPEEWLWIDRLNRIWMYYFRPLVTAVFLNKDIDSSSRIRLFEAIERFIFITFSLNGYYWSYGNRDFSRTVKRLRNNELTIDSIIQKLNDKMHHFFYTRENSTETYFDYKGFQNGIEKEFKKGRGFYAWRGLRYFLYEYEMDKVRQAGNQKIDWELFVKNDKDKVSIEHIYPQTPTHEYWKENFKGCKQSQQVFFQGTLGNLLPLSQSINSSLQNDCFDDKKKAKFNDKNEKIRLGYSEGSHSAIEVAGYDVWNPDSILDRGYKLLEFMERRWNLKFEDKSAKAKLLFLDFMLPDKKTENAEK